MIRMLSSRCVLLTAHVALAWLATEAVAKVRNPYGMAKLEEWHCEGGDPAVHTCDLATLS